MTAEQVPYDRARKRAKYLAGLIWHAGAFVIINAFFWILDLVTGQQGVQWAFWVSLTWGLALAFHALAYLVAGSQLEQRKAHGYLQDERGDRTNRP